MMSRNTLALFALPLFTTAALLGAGCSSDEPAGDGDGDGAIESTGEFSFCAPAEGTCPASTTGIDFDTPVSFKTDIYDAFLLNSCGGGLGTCHDSAASSGLALGKVGAPLDTTNVIQDLTTRISDISGTPNVVAGNWQGSFLMQKLDGCQNHAGFTCDSGASGVQFYSLCDEKPSPCGDAMPASEGSSSTPVAYALTKEQRDKVRVWIQQGAQDN